jgi:hypothetical protein
VKRRKNLISLFRKIQKKSSAEALPYEGGCYDYFSKDLHLHRCNRFTITKLRKDLLNANIIFRFLELFFGDIA